MNKYGIIYKCENKVNGKVYIGQTTKTLVIRKKRHQCDSFNGSGLYFHRALRKYGASKFRWTIIDTASSREGLDQKEVNWIEKCGSFDDPEKGYNMTSGGFSNIPGEESRKKMSESAKGRIFSEKHKQRIGNGNRKRVWSKTSLQRLRDANTGKTLSEATKKKISISNTGKTMSKKFCENLRGRMSGSSNPRYGKVVSEETKAKMSKAHKGNKRQAKLTVEQVLKIKEYPFNTDKTQLEISKEFGVTRECISRINTNKNWSYVKLEINNE